MSEAPQEPRLVKCSKCDATLDAFSYLWTRCAQCSKLVCPDHPLSQKGCSFALQFVCCGDGEKCRKWACECENHAMWDNDHWYVNPKVYCSWGNQLDLKVTLSEGDTLHLRFDDALLPSFWMEVSLEGDTITAKGRMENEESRCNLFGKFDTIIEKEATVKILDSSIPTEWVLIDFS